MNVPASITNLLYTKHSLYQRCKDPYGFINQVPRNFYKIGCKKCYIDERGKLIATYIYNDERDLELVINVEEKKVITNYFIVTNNIGKYRGRFKFSNE